MTTNKLVQTLKDSNQDFDFYPTTNEILEAIHNDLLSISKSQKGRSSNKSKIKFDICYNREKEQYDYTYHLDSLLDIGAGDGRVLEYFKTSNKYAVEKSEIQVTNLIKKGIKLIGRDFYETSLMDRRFDVCFSNPPYSIFKDFINKLVTEVNASIFYIVIPERWKNDTDLNRLIHKKGDVKVLGQFDFKEANRKARANVDLIRITTTTNDDTFRLWAEENIGEFKENEEFVFEDFDEEVEQAIINREKDLINILVSNYNNELQDCFRTYSKIASIDFSILKEIGVVKTDVLNSLKEKITSLKTKYWKKTFDTLDEITNRLTEHKRKLILEEIQWLSKMDFNTSNIRTLVIWVIENYNKLLKEQMIKVFDDITNFDKVKEYKSNEKWITDKWRYNNESDSFYNRNRSDSDIKNNLKYSLDYRIVVGCTIGKYDYTYNKEDDKRHFKNNTITDLCVIANSLGFTVKDIPTLEEHFTQGNKHEVICESLNSKDKVLFEYKMYLNGNTHFKLNKEFLMTLNIEVGKLRGWIKAPEDIQEEFKVSQSKALEYFKTSELKLFTNNQLLLS